MWQICIDVSGMPPDDIYIGLILFNDNYKPSFLTEFYSAFPQLRAFEKKSTKVDAETLFKTIQFFDTKRLRMVCYHFKSHQWKIHERKINELKQEVNSRHKYSTNFYRFNEKLMGILYYYAITQIGVKSQKYNVVACHESYLDIWEILKTIQKLAKRDGWDISPSVNIRKVEHLLKMSDYVAGANKKVDKFKMDSISRHTRLADPIREIELKRIFNIWDKQLRIGNFIK